MVDTDETESLNAKKINKQMIRQLLESGFATKLNKQIEDHSSTKVKHTKNKRDNVPYDEDSEDMEDPILLLEEVSPFNVSSQKDCYKNIYKNVLDAFEDALKIQMEDYKKCMCHGKKNQSSRVNPYSGGTIDIIPLTTSTLSPTTEKQSDITNVLDQFAVRNYNNGPAKEDDVICFNKKFAIILKDLLQSYNLNDTQEETPNSYNQNLTRSNRKVSKFTLDDQDDFAFDDEPIALKNGGKIDSDKSMKQLIEENLLLRFMDYLKTQQIQEDVELVSKSQVEDKVGKTSNRVDVKQMPQKLALPSEISNEENEFDMTKLLEELKGLFPASDSIKVPKETKNQEKPFHTIPKYSKSKRSEDSVKSTKQTKRKSRRVSSQEDFEETSPLSKRRSIASGSDESSEKIARKTSTIKKRDDERRVAEEGENERTSGDHKSAHNSRKKISFSINIPKSARGIIKKIKYDYE